MKTYQVISKQIINLSLNDSWSFFSNPENLSKITPPWLKLQITSGLPDKMYEGMIITYKIFPVLNIPAYWVTEITHIREKQFFVDEQRLGPYRFWHHQHFFKEIDEGVEMTDIVHYAIPFDPLSRPFGFIVGKKVKEIFKFRKEIIKKML